MNFWKNVSITGISVSAIFAIISLFNFDRLFFAGMVFSSLSLFIMDLKVF